MSNSDPFGKSLRFLFIDFVLFGWVATTIGATLPEVIRSMEWSYRETGIVIAGNSIGFFISTFCSGMVAHRLGFRAMFIGGLCIQGMSLGLFGQFGMFGVNVLLFVVLGLGQGLIEVATNYSVVQLEREGQSRWMNLIHAGFTLGAVSAPLFCGVFLRYSSSSWKWLYVLMCGFSLTLAIVLFVLRIEFPKPVNETDPPLHQPASAIRHPVIALLALTMFLYVGVEIGVSSWIAEFFVITHDAQLSSGAFMVSCFWFGVLLGRMLSFFKPYCGNQFKLLLGLTLFSSFALMGAVFLEHRTLASWMFFATGLGFSSIYPILVTLAGQSVQRGRGMAIGLVTTSGGVGLCVLPFFMAWLAEVAGIRFGFQFYFYASVLMVISSWLAFSCKRAGAHLRFV